MTFREIHFQLQPRLVGHGRVLHRLADGVRGALVQVVPHPKRVRDVVEAHVLGPSDVFAKGEGGQGGGVADHVGLHGHVHQHALELRFVPDRRRKRRDDVATLRLAFHVARDLETQPFGQHPGATRPRHRERPAAPEIRRLELFLQLFVTQDELADQCRGRGAGQVIDQTLHPGRAGDGGCGGAAGAGGDPRL